MTAQEKAEQRALELFPPKYIAETWVRQDPDRNAPLRAAYVKGYMEANDHYVDVICKMTIKKNL
ncbi:hypothetical protein [Succinimonas sp.]|uniref:hypothetical protein n=1 Tax=Succinimonas sp. TaxID=1936151 RepID=UPI00386D2084